MLSNLDLALLHDEEFVTTVSPGKQRLVRLKGVDLERERGRGRDVEQRE